MANVYGPKIIRDGLVLYLDKYNERSYLGEPTTNLVYYTNLDGGWSKGYNTDIVWNGITGPVGVDSPVVGFREGYSSNGTGYWYSYGDYCPQDPSTTYSVSMYVKTNSPNNVNLAFYTADNTETGRYWSGYLAVTASDGWKRLIWPNFTSASNAQSDSLSFYYYGLGTGATGSRLWLCAPQMEEKVHATKFIPAANNGTTTTRSSTDGWRDLSGYSNHADLSTLTYTATNVPNANTNNFYFDGATEYCDLPTLTSGSVKTITAWIKADVNHSGIVFGPHVNGHDNWFGVESRLINVFATQSADTNNFSANGVTYMDNDGWYYIAVTINYADKTVKCYLNGVVENSVTRTHTIGDWGGGAATIGRRGTISQRYFNGEIDTTSIYNRVLTASEILQNFNAHKGRYGL